MKNDVFREQSTVKIPECDSGPALSPSSLLAEIQRVIDEPSINNSMGSTCSAEWAEWLTRLVGAMGSDVEEGNEAKSHQLRVGRFQLRSILGCGSFGIVFRAHDPKLERDVAVKVLRPEAASSPKLVRRFLSEAKAAASLEHPGIISVYEVSREAGISYLAAPLCEGPDLATWLAKNPNQLTDVQIARLMADVASAVHHAHLRGILHRDLKPSNILLNPTNGSGPLPFRPMLTDFGLARRIDGDEQDTAHLSVLGTPAYMSPEQAAGRWNDVGVASDVFSLGVILYELLTEKRPFKGETLEDVRQATLLTTPHNPRSVRPKLSRDLETICLKCLAKDASHRYASADELYADLARFQNHEPIRAYPATIAQRLRLWCCKRPVYALLSAMLAASLLIGTLTAVVLYGREVRARFDAERARDHALAAETEANEHRNKARTAEIEARSQLELAIKAEKQAEAARGVAEEQKSRAQAINEFLIKDLLGQTAERQQASSGYKPDPQVTMRTILDRASAKIGDRFKDQPLSEVAIRSAIGESYSELGLLDEAQTHLEAALALQIATNGNYDESVFAAMQTLAGVYRRQGNLIAAETTFRQLFEAQKLLPDSRATRMTAINFAILYQQMKRDDLAKELLSWINDHASDDPLFFKARKLADSGHWELAEKIFLEDIAKKRQELGSGHQLTLAAINSLAYRYTRMHRYDLAEPLLLEFVSSCRKVNGEYHPFLVSPLEQLAQIYDAQGRTELAADFYNQWTVASRGKAFPTITIPLDHEVWLGDNLSRTRQFEKAIEHYCEALRLSPRSHLVLVKRGTAWFMLEEFGKAVDDLTESIELSPNAPGTWIWRGRAWGAQKEYQKALADFDEAIRRAPKSASAYCYRGILHHEACKYSEAIADLQQATAIDDKSFLALRNLAWLQATTPDPQFRNGSLALTNATKACEASNWKDAECLRSLAASHAELANFDEAVKWQEKAIAAWRGDFPSSVEKELHLYQRHQPFIRQKPVIDEHSSSTLRLFGAFGFPQEDARVLCDEKNCRVSVWNDAEHLYVQAIIWGDTNDDSVVYGNGKTSSDNSTLLIDVDGNGQKTPDVDRSYMLAPAASSQHKGLRYSVVVSTKPRLEVTKARADSKGRGAIRYVEDGDGQHRRVDSYLIPLAELEKHPGDSINLAYWAMSVRPKLTLNSVGFITNGPYWSTSLPLALYHRVTLADRPGRLNPEAVPEGRND